MLLFSGGQSGVKFPVQFLKNGGTKKNALSFVCSTAWDTHHIKKWTQSVYSSRSYSKNKVPYQMTREERYTTFRAKIERLNLRKRYIKYTYSETTLHGLLKTLNSVTQFKGSRCQRCQPDGVNRFRRSNRGLVPRPISRKQLNKKNALSTVCSTALDTNHI